MKKWLVAVAFSLLLLVPVGIQNAFGGAEGTPVSIVFMEKIGDCKIFKMNKGVSPLQEDLLIKAVRVNVITGSLLSTPTIVPDATTIGGSNFVEFTYVPANGQTPQAMATLTVCPSSDVLKFEILIVTEPKVEIGKLVVHEQLVDAAEVNSFEFTSQFLVPKNLPTDCTDQIIITGSTNVVQGTLDIKCEGKSSGNSQVTITGTPIDETMPAIHGIVIDPLGDTFLLVSEVCILNADNSFVCPTDIDLNLEFDLPTKFEDGDGGCTVDPDMVDAGILPFGERFVLIKTITCSSEVTKVELDNSDCGDHRIDVRLGDFGINQGVWEGEEVIDNNNSFPGKTTCTVDFNVDFDGSIDILTQTIMVTTPGPIVPPVVGGELIPIETISLILAGAQSFSWMIPAVLSILGIGLFVVSRKPE